MNQAVYVSGLAGLQIAKVAIDFSVNQIQRRMHISVIARYCILIPSRTHPDNKTFLESTELTPVSSSLVNSAVVVR